MARALRASRRSGAVYLDVDDLPFVVRRARLLANSPRDLLPEGRENYRAKRSVIDEAPLGVELLDEVHPDEQSHERPQQLPADMATPLHLLERRPHPTIIGLPIRRFE